MKEEFLHYIWKYGLFDKDKLIDSSGNQITVLHPGEYNRDSGPDFFNARIRAGGLMWAGNVEIHIRASDFSLHRHHRDPAYNNIILHLASEIDGRVLNEKGEEIPTVRLIYDDSVLNNYLDLVNNPAVIACQDNIKDIDRYHLHHWLSVLLLERMKDKTEHVKKMLELTSNDWDETFYRLIARYFGFRVNREPFELLATALPFRIIRKHSDNLLQVEALLFGTAGLLEIALFEDAASDSYFRLLRREYKILSAKYSLKPLHGWIWKFSRLRPANFPTIRLSQLASLLSCSSGLFSKVVELSRTEDIMKIFMVPVSDYWREHYSFGKKSRTTEKRSGMQMAQILAINAVVPLLFAYGKAVGSEEIREKALNYLEGIPPEENSIIEDWALTGISADSAFMSQALLQLRNEYCRRRRCLSCMIGLRILNRGHKLKDQKDLLLEQKSELGS